MQNTARERVAAAPKVFDYGDYRTYLVDHFRHTKGRNPAWSYQAWAQKLGLKNNTSLLKIVHGERHAGPEIAAKLVNYFKLSTREAQYFDGLVLLAKNAKNPSAKVLLMQRLQSLHPRRDFQVLDEAKFRAISDWVHYGIRQLAKRPDFERDVEWIADRLLFNVQRRTITQALATLEKLGLIVQDETGRWTVSAESLNTPDDVSSEGLKRYHESVLKLAGESLRSVPLEEREISGLSLLLAEADLGAAKEYLRKVQDDFSAQFGRRSVNGRAYALEIALFPLSKPTSKEGSAK